MQLDGKETKALVQLTANKVDEAQRSWSFYSQLIEAETPLQGARNGGTIERGCLLRIRPLIKISHLMPNIRGLQRGSSREISSRNGGPIPLHPSCGSTGNVRPSVPHVFPDIDHCELL